MKFNKEEIKGILPHREPMLLIDEAEIDESGIAHARYTICLLYTSPSPRD